MPVPVLADDHHGPVGQCCRRAGTLAGPVGHREDDIGAEVDQLLGGCLTLLAGHEVGSEQPLAAVPSHHRGHGSVNHVVMHRPAAKAVHVRGHRRDVESAECPDDPGGGHSRCQIPGKEGRFIDLEGETAHVRRRRRSPRIEPTYGMVENGEAAIGVGGRGGGRVGGHQHPGGHHQIASHRQSGIDVAPVIALVVRPQELDRHAEVGRSPLHAVPGDLVDRLVLDAAEVGHLTGEQSGPGWWRGGDGGAGAGGAHGVGRRGRIGGGGDTGDWAAAGDESQHYEQCGGFLAGEFHRVSPPQRGHSKAGPFGVGTGQGRPPMARRRRGG